MMWPSLSKFLDCDTENVLMLHRLRERKKAIASLRESIPQGDLMKRWRTCNVVSATVSLMADENGDVAPYSKPLQAVA